MSREVPRVERFNTLARKEEEEKIGLKKQQTGKGNIGQRKRKGKILDRPEKGERKQNIGQKSYNDFKFDVNRDIMQPVESLKPK